MATILVVDDEAGLRHLIETVLREDGYTIVTAADGRVAESYLQSDQAIDLVLTDIFMPEQDGIGVLLAAQRTRRGLPIIAMSGGAQVIGGDFLDAASRLGVAMTLRKPFSLKELRESVSSVLAGAA